MIVDKAKIILSCCLVWILIFSFSVIQATNLEDALVLQYDFNQTEGTEVYDSSENQNHGTLYGNVEWADGQFNGAIDLKGEDGFVQLPPGIMQDLDEITIAVWIKQNITEPWQRVFDLGNGPGESIFLTVTSAWNDTHFVMEGPVGGHNLLHAPSLQSRENWRHILVTIKDSEAVIYVDAQELERIDDVDFRPADLGQSTQSFIGKSQYPDPYFDGKIDDFRIYDQALEHEEIWQVYAPNMYHGSEAPPKYSGQ